MTLQESPTDHAIVIIGAGPAGLTAALELQAAGLRNITVLEADTQVGGISRTVAYHGNRIDIGGHRFFSKSDWVMDWWRQLLPVATPANPDVGRELRYQGGRADLPESTASEADDNVLLVRSRLSRIYFNKRFFDYPLKLNPDTLLKLGPWKTFTFGLSYVWARLHPRKPEASLEDFLINRFGRKLYRQFFKEYTEKVWGVPCHEISAAWGAQRIKSLSVTKAIAHALKKLLGLGDKAAQTSLIESFLYPKYGPGQMWETAAARFVAQGGVLRMQSRVDGIDIVDGQVRSVRYRDAQGMTHVLPCTHVLSTMPIKDLVAAAGDAFPQEVREIASRLSYRDFITVGLLYPRQAIPRQLDDNWIYIQEPGVNVGRVQIFNNWSPYMVADPATLWMGLEFFCKETDPLWQMDDAALKALAHREMVQIGLVRADAPLDAVVLRVPKAYPGYFGEAYARFDVLQAALDAIPNLFLIGRNGMHRYNNQDHSMLTAREAVRQIVNGQIDKAAIWAINVDDEYHEEKS
ncbi:MAG: NAD(P)/FAD-dependent oxidoreductase [Thermomonas hydrothermalis]|uniref:NAD(P)/FAD-dependent oxidoreductase n=1 Tax=Thermomonas hydrothermalis TaxID=213588 RepID=UPI002355A0D3|nr:NAD(P)/FAD-dependent oxidoreductase [Thermomonas hydrothermalis]MCL6618176.1 NAD(P)/FAD-dependent oxidoreductase [Thermomonas hydrothermalis]